ncbi:hypothetical protein KIPE111705_39905 [Kibdelosporangium persicum]|uniref:Uncharacterized protein n=1 Tax=Kibdelosporangium persicum TaxID=2698649 RepID=A0ABX2F7H5_9PSEU|nr:hypothetical protein [Kibdelosporangium persicum]NRN66842.1 hypothetical protein [Kibdelosporangium persicum]
MNDFLGIYLNDQLAMGVLWRDMARRSQRSNRGTDFGDALAEVAQGISEDVETFREIMRRVGVPMNPLKVGLASAAERLGRLKLNGSLTSYSPLSRFVELEFLAMGIDGKKQMWTTLRDQAGLAERIPEVDFDALIERAEAQRQILEPFRARAGTDAFQAGRMS